MRRIAAGAAVLLFTASTFAAGQDTPDSRTVLQKVELLEAVQLRILRELESLSAQLAELRKAAPAGPSRGTPPPPALPTAPQSIVDAASKGNDGAAVVLIEYADFQCPYCGQFARQVLPAIQKKYVDTGKVKVVFRHMPLQEIHPQALMAAEAAECARQQDKFWELHDAFFADQRLDERSLVEKVRTSGMDLLKFSDCARGPGGARVRQDIGAARTLGLNVTPTFFVGRTSGAGLVTVEKVLTGLRPIDAFEAAIEALLNEPGK